MTEPSYPRMELAHGWLQEAEIPANMAYIETVCYYLVDSPAWYPHWRQYAVTALRLTDDAPGFPPVNRELPGATHELTILVLDPDQPGYPYPDANSLIRVCATVFPYLMPANLAAQFVATDDEMRALTKVAVIMIISGYMNPEPFSLLPTQPWGEFLASAITDIRKSFAQGSTDENH